jgi:ubiquinone/menaquinone biosynthesis C-methylase UbiE
MGAGYIMEGADEVRRLEIKTEASVVERFARMAGLAEGMRVVDAGCGPGLTTSVLRSIVGSRGSALGFDISQARIDRALEAYAGPGTSFVVRDFRKPLEGIGSFDFAWIRFGLEYYKAECFDIARNLSDLLPPGGTLCLVDLDHNCLNHWGIPERLEKALVSVTRQLEAESNFDPYAGRKLYSHLYRMGYRDIRVEAAAHHLIYGELRGADEYNWGKKVEVLTRNPEVQLPGYSGAEEFYEDFMAFFRDPGRFTYTPVIAAWGRKAEAPD